MQCAAESYTLQWLISHKMSI